MDTFLHVVGFLVYSAVLIGIGYGWGKSENS